VGEPVELAAHGVAPVHDGMPPAGLAGGPPAGEGLAVVGEFVVDDLEVSGGVVGIMEAVGDGELGGVGGVVMTEDAEPATGVDGAVLGGIADEPEGGAGPPGEPAQVVEVAVGGGGGSVDDEDGAGVEGAVWGSSWARYQASVSVGMPVAAARCGRLRLDGGADDSPAGGVPGVAGGGHGGGLAGAGPADGALDAVSAGAERAHEVALLVGELWLSGKGLVDGGGGDEGGAPWCRPWR
jgi:hypothetical protein